MKEHEDASRLAAQKLEEQRQGNIKVKEQTILALVRELSGDAAPMTQGTVGGLLLELQRRRREEAEAKKGNPSTLEEAANLLLGVMDPSHSDHLKDMAHEMPMARWILMLGAVANACDRRELREGLFNHAWLNSPEGIVPAREIPRCELCGLEIPGGRRGQAFCCNLHGVGKADHSPECPVLPKREPVSA